jgi:hypothetical protein
MGMVLIWIGGFVMGYSICGLMFTYNIRKNESEESDAR